MMETNKGLGLTIGFRTLVEFRLELRTRGGIGLV